ncbi:MAG: sugar kinase [Lysobacterales bacterium]
MSASQRRIILVTRRTRLEDLVIRLNTVEQARFYVEHMGADFSDYETEQRQYHAAVASTSELLSLHGRVQRLERKLLPNFLFPPDALVVVVGQDGLVANTLKYLQGQPVIGVNPDPARWDGVLLPFGVGDLAMIVPEALQGKRPSRSISMAQVRLSDGQTLHAVNDLFIGPRSHVSARYLIELAARRETHSSSGIIVSTGLGSTGWFRSLLTGALALTGAADEELQQLRENGFPWEARMLYFTVREPFPSRSSQAELVFGRIEANQQLRLVSQMPDYGVIFSDGLEQDFLAFNSGMEAQISVAERQGVLVQ